MRIAITIVGLWAVLLTSSVTAAEIPATSRIDAVTVYLSGAQVARSARIMAHMQHYHDELLRDFGASPWRKTGAFAPLKELIVPYGPRDYRTIVAGRKPS